MSNHEALVRRYEDRAAALIGAPRTLAFANARTALACLLRTFGLEPGDSVMLSPLTCKVVPMALRSLQLRPHYVDISAATLNMDLTQAGLPGDRSPRAVLFQLTYGISAGLDSAAHFAAQHQLPIIEDRAQCLPLVGAGASGRHGPAIFSNNLLKPFPAGSGGLAVVDDERFADQVESNRRAYRHPGTAAELALRISAFAHDRLLNVRTYWPMLRVAERLDSGYRAKDLAAELREFESQTGQIGRYQLHRAFATIDSLQGHAAARRAATADYARRLEGVGGIEVPAIESEAALYYYPVLVADKTALLERARRRSIEIVAWPRTTPIYPIADASGLRNCGYEPGSCPVAEDVARRLVGLPTHAKVTARQRAHIVDLVRSAAA